MQIHQGIDILGEANQPIIAIADGIVLETDQKFCEGPSVVIDHGKGPGENPALFFAYSLAYSGAPVFFPVSLISFCVRLGSLINCASPCSAELCAEDGSSCGGRPSLSGASGGPSIGSQLRVESSGIKAGCGYRIISPPLPPLKAIRPSLPMISIP